MIAHILNDKHIKLAGDINSLNLLVLSFIREAETMDFPRTMNTENSVGWQRCHLPGGQHHQKMEGLLIINQKSHVF